MSCNGGTCGCSAVSLGRDVSAQEPELVSGGCSTVEDSSVVAKGAERVAVDRGGSCFEGTAAYPLGLMVGLDVGSTTVKAVVVDPAVDEILWKDYQRHETRQPEKCLEFFDRIEEVFADVPRCAFRIFVTGSGGGSIARHLGGCFVQEVNAVSLAVEKLYPDVRSVVELGGQDAKIIIFKDDESTGRKKKIPSMNDKCAGGTGAVIDKINAKLQIPSDALCEMRYVGERLHPVAGKCGVFAETDINGLQKQGVPAEELMASLFESIVQQNLAVLTRGHTLMPTVLLLGGPNCYVRGMKECWRHNISLLWEERGVLAPAGKTMEELVVVPDNAQYFAAVGAVVFGMEEVEDQVDLGVYAGRDSLAWFISDGRLEERKASGGHGLSSSAAALAAFQEAYSPERWCPKPFVPSRRRGRVVEAFVGVDGGSTSTKAVLVDRDKNVIAKTYQLSQGNPIEDCMDMFRKLEEEVVRQGFRLEVLGVGTTGYAKDILKDVIGADVALVETVAHTESGLHFYPDADVICDVGGQDIKVILLNEGRVKDFRLNTQCSAGNGYFLQSTGSDFGYRVEEYAEVAFGADSMPAFGYGCAVFMQSDIVDFQRQGWQPHEIMAGLASVLPKNIWLYVSQIPNLPKLGSTFVLQGGTQHNLAAVKSQVDFIRSRFAGTGVVPQIVVHKHCGESGAIGCAFEAHRLYHTQSRRTHFIGLEAVRSLSYKTTRDENTRCYFCKNNCLRTFIDVRSGALLDESINVDAQMVKFLGAGTRLTRMKSAPTEEERRSADFESKVPLQDGEQRLIIATCEKGTVEDVNDMKNIKKGMDSLKKQYPNLVDVAAKKVFQQVVVPNVSDCVPVPRWFERGRRRGAVLRRASLMERRGRVRIGMPRVLNMYSQAPFFMAYFQSLGVKAKNLIWSDFTSEEMYKEGAKRGSIDPCFPSKVGIPHVHNLLYHKHCDGRALDYIFFPMVDSFPTWLYGVEDVRACPTVCSTPEATHAAFIKESDLFVERGITFKKTFLNLDNTALCARQMQQDWSEALGIGQEESLRAAVSGIDAMAAFQVARRREARAVLDTLEEEGRLGIVLLSRPYHNDPGINHEICDEFQKLGYPVFAQDSLPIDEDLMERLFGQEVAAGEISSPFDIKDVWKNSYSENTSRKVWAAKYVARHPNLVGLELSNFKCGHDAPIYTVVEEIVERSGTPFFYFKDIDENKPVGSIKIRVETIAYFLKRYEEGILRSTADKCLLDAGGEDQNLDLGRSLGQESLPVRACFGGANISV